MPTIADSALKRPVSAWDLAQRIKVLSAEVGAVADEN